MQKFVGSNQWIDSYSVKALTAILRPSDEVIVFPLGINPGDLLAVRVLTSRPVCVCVCVCWKCKSEPVSRISDRSW